MLDLHNDALVTLLVANYSTRRIPIDNSNLVDILFWEAFVKMGIDAAKLKPSPTPLKDVIQPVDAITFLVIAQKGTRIATTMTNFLVMKAPSSSNTILRRLTLNNLRAVTSTYHLKMKFTTDGGVGEACGEHTLAQECYVHELKSNKDKVCTIESNNEQVA